MTRSWPTVLVVILALVLVAAMPALAPAAEDHAAPKKDIFLPPRLDLTLWTVAVFALLVLVLSKFAWKPMIQALQGREDRIRGALDEAQTARDDAQKLRQDLHAEMNKVQDKIREMMDEARREAQQNKDRMVGEGKAEIQAEKERARREIQAERDQAVQELWSQTAQLATLVSAKVVGRSLNADDHRNLVDEAVAELRVASAQRTTA
jgi:F-type H+-transporting ATPase subunit b